MTDEMQLLNEFRADVPPADEQTAQRVYARAVEQRPRRVRRNRLAVAVAASVLVFSAAAVAAVKETPWWQDGEPPVDPQAVAMVARDNMPAAVRVADARTVAHDGDAALVAVPLDATGYCVIPAIGDHADLGASCLYRTDDGSMDLFRSAKQADDRWLVYGRIADPRAAKLDLGIRTLDLARGGFFLADIPRDDWAKLAGTATPATVQADDGSILSSGCANWGDAPGATNRFEAAFWVEPQDGKCAPEAAPAPPTLDLAHAVALFDVTLSQPYSIWKPGETITFERVPESTGGTCVFANGPRLPAMRPGCSQTGGSRMLNVGTGATLAHDGAKAFYAWDIQGTAAANVAKVEIRSGSTVVEAKLGGGYFFAQLPVTTPGPVTGTVPFPDGQWDAVAYDALGDVIARVDLDAFYRSATPH